MKNILIILTLALTTLGAAAQKAYDHFQIQVDGLGCPFCAYGLEKKFKEFKGLKKVTIDIETGNFEFDYPSEKTLEMEAIIQQVQKAGYTPKTAKIIRNNGAIESHSTATSNSNINSKNKQNSLKVSGNCEMCKARIEATVLSIKGIETANWNTFSKQLVFSTTQNISTEIVASKIAEAGHDNKLKKANKEVYNNLPPCCAYRK